MRKVLIFPGSTEIAREIVQGLGSLPGYRLFGAGFDTEFGWKDLYESFFVLPSLRFDEFDNLLLELIAAEEFTHIYPSNDEAILRLKGMKLPTYVTLVSHPEDSVRTSSSKALTYEKFLDDFFTPRIFGHNSSPQDFPIFYKPQIGHSSIGTGLLYSADEFSSAISNPDFLNENIITEFLPGQEVTVDCFSTTDQGLLMAMPRLRAKTERGIATVTADFASPELEEIARVINARLPFNGAWFFQAKMNRYGEFKLLEIATRLGGASGIRRGQGINLPHLSVLAAEGFSLELIPAHIRLRAERKYGQTKFFPEHHYSKLFLDLDDTLILNGKVNAQLRDLITVASSAGATVNLITRHASDLPMTLEKFGLSDMFNHVIHIQNGLSKAEFMVGEERTVFIDDSFSERKSCLSLEKVVCVDASAAKGLEGFFE